MQEAEPANTSRLHTNLVHTHTHTHTQTSLMITNTQREAKIQKSLRWGTNQSRPTLSGLPQL